MDFCCIYEFDPMPACQNTLLSYVAYLNNRYLKHGSISVYLAAVRSMHIEAGYPNPLENCLQLQRAVRATNLFLVHQSKNSLLLYIAYDS